MFVSAGIKTAIEVVNRRICSLFSVDTGCVYSEYYAHGTASTRSCSEANLRNNLNTSLACLLSPFFPIRHVSVSCRNSGSASGSRAAQAIVTRWDD